jgi:predicted DNA-binding transcriptional regulator YafY
MLSPARLLLGPPARLVAHCHKDRKLKWFRVSNITEARIDAGEAFRSLDPSMVDAFVSQSVDGFHSSEEAVPCSFVVREPESRWVERNLPSGVRSEPIEGGIRATTSTAGLAPLARFVVGLGSAATCESPELAALVRELAEGALANLVKPQPSSRKR